MLHKNSKKTHTQSKFFLSYIVLKSEISIYILNSHWTNLIFDSLDN